MVKMRSKQAFTMIEMIIVIMLIGVIFAVVGPRIASYLGMAQKSEVKLKMAALKDHLTEYKMAFGVFPNSKEGLQALITNPRPNVDFYKKEADRWPMVKEEGISYKGTLFQYHCPPEKFKGKYKYYEIYYEGATESENFDDGM